MPGRRSGLRSIGRSLGLVLLAGMATGLLGGCADPVQADAPRIGAGRTVAVRFGLSEDVSYSLFGLDRQFTTAEPGNWGANQALLAGVTQALAGVGKEARLLEAGALAGLKPQEEQSRAEAIQAISRAMAAAPEARGAELHLIIAPVPLRPNSLPAAPTVAFLFQGVAGLLWEAMADQRIGYVVMPKPFLVGDAGNVMCSVGYDLAVTDARTHALLFNSANRVMQTTVPPEVPATPYPELTAEQKQAVGRACVAGLRQALLEQLAKAGLAPTVTAGR